MRYRFLLRRTPIVALLLTVALAGPRAAGQAPTTAADIVTRVRAQFAPDTRVAVFDVKAETKENAVELTGDVEQAAAKDALIKALKDGGFPNVVDKIAVLPDPAFSAKPLGVVTVSVAVMKTKPSQASELGNQLIMGMVVKLLKKDGGWYFVQSLDDRYLGWMEPDHLALVTKEQGRRARRRAARRRHGAVHPSCGNRPRPTGRRWPTSSSATSSPRPGRAGTGSPVQLPDGRNGFVNHADATDHAAWKAARAITPDNVEQAARQFRGVPYLWGRARRPRDSIAPAS